MADAGRVAKLELALRLAVQRSITIESEAFLNSFPSDVIANHRELLLNLHSSIPRTLETAILWEAEQIAKELDLHAKLTELDDLSLAQPPFGDRGQRVPPPGPAPADAMKARELELRREEVKRLEETLVAAEAARTEATRELQRKQAKRTELLTELGKVSKDLERCVALGKDWKEADLLAQEM